MNELSKLALAALGALGALYLASLAYREDEAMEPSVLQWTNRLIEHVEPENIVEASKRFLYLIESGLVPAHAFEMVIRT